MNIRDINLDPYQFNSDQRTKILDELNSLQSRGQLNLFSKIAHKIYGFITHLFEEGKHHEALRTQEHLFQKEGSVVDDHQQVLIDALKKKSGVGFNQLLVELKEMPTRYAYMSASNSASLRFPRELKNKLNALKNGGSLWID